MALHILFSSTHSPDSQQYFEIVTGKSTFFSASGDQGARVKCCEVCEDSWEQKAQFSLVYILKYLLFEIHCEMQHTRLLHLLQKEFQHGIMSVQHFLESALFSTSRKKTLLELISSRLPTILCFSSSVLDILHSLSLLSLPLK